MSPEEEEYFKQLSEENKSTQKMLSDIRNILLQDKKDKHFDGRGSGHD